MARLRDTARPAAIIPDTAYIPALDGLRALSIGLVVLAHLGLGRIIPGGLGVTLFFFISGLLITRQLLAELARSGRIDLLRFSLRRLVRLYPALLVMIVLGGAAYVALGGVITTAQLAAAAFYYANYTFIAGGFDGGRPLHPYTILWSLAVEEHFYLGFPLVTLLLRRHAHAFVATLIAVMLAVLAWRLTLVLGCAAEGQCGGLSDRIGYATDTRIDSILFGALLSTLLAGSGGRGLLRALESPLIPAAGLVLLLASLVIRAPQFRDAWRYTEQGVAMLLLIGWLVYTPGAASVRRLLALPPLVLLGRLSYSLYLWHWAILAACAARWPGRTEALVVGEGMRNPTQLTLAAAVLLLSAAAAAASYYGVERPALKLRRRLGSHAPAGITAG